VANPVQVGLEAHGGGCSCNLALCAEQQSLVTFDKTFVKRAAKLTLTPEVKLVLAIK
jgi:hypothetical protein